MKLEEFIKQARELCDKATGGPWVKSWWEVETLNPDITGRPISEGRGGAEICCFESTNKDVRENDDNNIKFIAESRQLVPKLLKIIEMQNEAINKLKHSECIGNHIVFYCKCPKCKTIKQIEELLNE